MSDAATPSFPDFGKFVPGFDFLQGLASQSAAQTQKLPQMPSLGSWVAPTLNVEELDKRIQELKAVQFWLDQNAMALKATIQALEVQKMTLATLKGMNFNMTEMANAFKLKVDEPTASSAAEPAREKSKASKGFAGLEIPPTSFGNGKAAASETPDEKETTARPEGAAAAAGVVDPMQWWGALTQQFQAIAADAMKDAAHKAAVAPAPASSGLTDTAMKAASTLAESASNAVTSGARAMSTALRSNQAWPLPAAKKATSTRAAAKPKPKPATRKAPRKTAR